MTAPDKCKDCLSGQNGGFISPPRQGPDGKITAEAVVPPASDWFSGHFPVEPILPGIAQLALVLEAIQSTTGRRLRIAGARRVRFRQVVKPNDRMDIFVTPPAEDKAGYAFRVSVLDAVVCSGTLDMV